MSEVLGIYNKDLLKKIHAYTEKHDVEDGGIFFATASCINIWSHPWVDAEDRKKSVLIGSLLIEWIDGKIILGRNHTPYENKKETMKVWTSLLDHFNEGKDFEIKSIEKKVSSAPVSADAISLEAVCPDCEGPTTYDSDEGKFFCGVCHHHVEEWYGDDD